MKTSFIFCLAFSLLVTPTLQALPYTFDKKIFSNEGDATITNAANGQLITISTQNGFSWVRSDSTGDETTGIYTTLVCATGSVAWGFSGYSLVPKEKYTQWGQVFPFLGSTLFDNGIQGNNLLTDSAHIYYPTKPGITSWITLNKPLELGTTYAFFMGNGYCNVKGKQSFFL